MLLLVRVLGMGKATRWTGCGALEGGPEDPCVSEVQRSTLQQVLPGKLDWHQVNSDEGSGPRKAQPPLPW